MSSGGGRQNPPCKRLAIEDKAIIVLTLTTKISNNDTITVSISTH